VQHLLLRTFLFGKLCCKFWVAQAQTKNSHHGLEVTRLIIRSLHSDTDSGAFRQAFCLKGHVQSMGQAHSRCSSGKQLIQATVEQNTQAARQILSVHPEASCYSTCIDRNSPLLVAAGQCMMLMPERHGPAGSLQQLW
jgi:hypothetical protein